MSGRGAGPVSCPRVDWPTPRQWGYGGRVRPLVPSRTATRVAQIAPRAIRPRCAHPAAGLVLRSDIRCPRELEALLIYGGSRETLGRVHDPVLSSGKATEVVHPLSLSAQVVRPLNARLK